MTDIERKLLLEMGGGEITRHQFYKEFPVDIRNSKDYVINEIRSAIDKENVEELELAISMIWLSENVGQFVDILNELLINPNHLSHQLITKTIQESKNPSSIPYIKRVLQSNFDYLAYTGSDSDAIAKWFSWALHSIGTKEAIDVMKEYAKSEDEGIRNEMIYRLSKMRK
jgi:hypothetical protein